jgi:hypothetical protein
MAAVRKRTVIAVVAVLMIGVFAYMLSLPHRGSVEWHKGEYLRARDWGRVEQWIEINAPYNLRKAHAERKAKRTEIHLKALFELGYFEERVFVLSNSLTKERGNALWTLHHVFTNDVLDVSGIKDMGTNAVTVIGLHEEMPQWQEAIRKIDVP